jgi:hypothetical protein
MEKHFVTYEQSLALKELGFDEPCMGKYDTKQSDEWVINIYSGHLNTQFGDKNNACIAPLRSQVFEFFRGYRLTVVIEDYLDDYEVKIVEWTLSDDRITHEFPNRFDSWGDAESASIDKLIELVKKK